MTPDSLAKVFSPSTDSFLDLVRQVLDMAYLPDYKDSVFLQKRHLETADLYEPPLDMFGADAVERWFTEKEIGEVVEFANRLAIERGKP